MRKLSFILAILIGFILNLSPGYCADVATPSNWFSKPLGTKEKTIGTNTTLIPYCAIDGAVTADTELSAASAAADATSNPTAGGALTFPHVFNTITWDRIRAIANGLDSTGTGFLGVGILGQLDDTAPSTVTENNFSTARITGARGLHINLRNNAGTEIGTATNPVRTDPTGTTIQPVSGTVTANAGTGTYDVMISQTTTSNDVDVASIAAGNNNIGDIDVATVAAGTNRIGGTYSVNGQVIDESGNVLTIKTAFANVAASTTDGNIITAVASRKLRVLGAQALAGGTATNLTFNTKPAGAGTAISALWANGVNGGEVFPFTANGFYFQTNLGDGLTVTTGAGSTTGIQVQYVEVP